MDVTFFKLVCFFLWLAFHCLQGSNSKIIEFAPVRNFFSRNDFKVYWNAPTFMCARYNITFENLAAKYNIIQNEDDQFRGNKIVILYDPGAFPAFLNASQGTILVRNGGVPQEGNLTYHLQIFQQHLTELVPVNFNGIGIIDMESWRPVFRQNFAKLKIYHDYSIDLERERHPKATQEEINIWAKKKFELAARTFMKDTLKLVKKLRPKAQWGYYAYPYCFNWSPSWQYDSCPPIVTEENDRISWLFQTSEILFPSVYLSQKLTADQRTGMVRGRVKEAVRLAAETHPLQKAKVLPYWWYKYQDDRELYVNERDILSTIGEIKKQGANGLVVWGSSNDFKTATQCQAFYNYFSRKLGPALFRIQK